MGDTTEAAAYLTAQDIADILAEPNVALVKRVIRVIGGTRAEAFVNDALRLEGEGGMLTEDKSRRRTPGGTFFALVRQGVSRQERFRIFGSGLQGTPQAPMPAMCTWEQLIEATKALPAHTEGEGSTVKITLIGRPGSAVQTKGQTVVFKMTGKAPSTLPKGLPPIPKSPAITWTVVVGLRQWNRVKESLQKHPDDKLILDGYPHVDGDQHLVFVNGCRSILMERAQKASQQAERAAQGGATA